MEIENRFKVGDILIGNKSNPYAKTNKSTMVEVVKLRGRLGGEAYVTVKILKGESAGQEYDVREKFFDYYMEPILVDSKEYENAFSLMLGV